MDAVCRTPGWELLAPVPLQTVCLRHGPPGVTDGTVISAHNRRLAERVNAAGGAYLTTTELGGGLAIRVSVGAMGTERKHVEAVWAALQAAAQAEG